MIRLRSVARELWQVASIPLLAIVLAFIVAAVVVVISSTFTSTGFDVFLPFGAYASLLAGAFGSGTALSNTLVAAAPLILGGLAVGLGFKAGLFNIGVAGQFLVGAFASAVVGSSLATSPTPVGMPLAVVAGAR